MNYSEESIRLVNNFYDTHEEVQNFFKAKNCFNTLPLWSAEERVRYFEIKSVKDALEEYDYFNNGRDSYDMTRFEIPKDIIRDNYNNQDFGYSSDVRDQGQDGACWSYSVCSSLESQAQKKGWKKRSGQPYIFSRKFLIESRNKIYTFRHGEWLHTAFYRIKNIYKGILQEEDMPTTKLPNGGFEFARYRKKMNFTVSKIITIKNAKHRVLQDYIMNTGDIPASFDLNRGLLIGSDICRLGHIQTRQEPKLKPTYHAMTITGWAWLRGNPVWICQNTWGKNTGRLGYFYVPMVLDMGIRERVDFGILTKLIKV